MKVTGDKLIRSYITTTIFVTNLCFLSFFFVLLRVSSLFRIKNGGEGEEQVLN